LRNCEFRNLEIECNILFKAYPQIIQTEPKRSLAKAQRRKEKQREKFHAFQSSGHQHLTPCIVHSLQPVGFSINNQQSTIINPNHSVI